MEEAFGNPAIEPKICRLYPGTPPVIPKPVVNSKGVHKKLFLTYLKSMYQLCNILKMR